MCVLVFCTNSVRNISRSKQNWTRYDNSCTQYTDRHVQYPLFFSGFWNLSFLDRFSIKPLIYNFMKIRPVVAELFHADRQTDAQTWWRQYRFRIVWPCIVTDCFWMKPTENFPIIYLWQQQLYIGSFSAHHQELISRTTALVQFMQFSGLLLSAVGHRTAYIDDGQKNCPKHVELLLPLINNWKITVHLLVLFKSKPVSLFAIFRTRLETWTLKHIKLWC